MMFYKLNVLLITLENIHFSNDIFLEVTPPPPLKVSWNNKYLRQILAP